MWVVMKTKNQDQVNQEDQFSTIPVEDQWDLQLLFTTLDANQDSDSEWLLHFWFHPHFQWCGSYLQFSQQLD